MLCCPVLAVLYSVGILIPAGTRGRYVDILNPGGVGTKPRGPAPAPADLFAPLAPMPIPANLFVPGAGVCSEHSIH